LYLTYCWFDLKNTNHLQTILNEGFTIDINNHHNIVVPKPYENQQVHLKRGERLYFKVDRVAGTHLNVINERLFRFRNGFEIVILQNFRPSVRTGLENLEIYYEIPFAAEVGCGNRVYSRVYITVLSNILTYVYPIVAEVRNNVDICVIP